MLTTERLSEFYTVVLTFIVNDGCFEKLVKADSYTTLVIKTKQRLGELKNSLRYQVLSTHTFYSVDEFLQFNW